MSLEVKYQREFKFVFLWVQIKTPVFKNKRVEKEWRVSQVAYGGKPRESRGMRGNNTRSLPRNIFQQARSGRRSILDRRQERQTRRFQEKRGL